MKTMTSAFVLLALATLVGASKLSARDLTGEQTEKLRHEIQSNGHAFTNLAELTKLGHRLSGSAGAAKAVAWAKAKMESYQFDRVFLQPVSVPHWERGKTESAEIKIGNQISDLEVTALGNSAGTAVEGISAEVLEVHSLAEVDILGNKIRGKIVFYNRPMNAVLKDTFAAYGQAVDQRSAGPARAAKYGALAALVRTMTTLNEDPHPHTGLTVFRNAAIPAAALSTDSANKLSAALKKDPALKLNLKLSAKLFAPVISFNVIGEIRGKESPDEIVLVGGHLDSWDLAQGAHDDGAGAVQSIEVLRAFKALKMTPRRTLRAVLFMAEEWGGIGGAEYAKQAAANHEHHLSAIESDRGGFAPRGFTIDAEPNVTQSFQKWIPFLSTIKADSITTGGSGTDVEPLSESGTVTIGYVSDSTHYFDLHHSALDVLTSVIPTELNDGAAAIAILTYLLSEKGIDSND